jgi:uncharacterized protein YlaN (UPF0358 family)
MAVRQQTQRQSGFTIVEQTRPAAELDLVVPFTTPELTRVALDAANRMGAGLNAALRLIKVQVVPFPLDPDQCPVYIDFLKQQLADLKSELPAAGEIRLARDFGEGLEGTLGRDSIVILATPKRPWRTRTERLASALRRRGHKVVLISPVDKQEAQNA